MGCVTPPEDVPTRDPDPEVPRYHNEAWLQFAYWGLRLSSIDMARECDVSKNTILRWLHKHEIPTRRANPTFDTRYRNVLWLERKYIGEELSTCEIGTLCKCDKETIRRWLIRFGIERRDRVTGHGVSCYWVPGGYRRVQVGDHSINEHTLVALGDGADPHKVFSEDYHVHHIRENPGCNTPENLKLVRRENHARIHHGEPPFEEVRADAEDGSDASSDAMTGSAASD